MDSGLSKKLGFPASTLWIVLAGKPSFFASFLTDRFGFSLRPHTIAFRTCSSFDAIFNLKACSITKTRFYTMNWHTFISLRNISRIDEVFPDSICTDFVANKPSTDIFHLIVYCWCFLHMLTKSKAIGFRSNRKSYSFFPIDSQFINRLTITCGFWWFTIRH